MAVLFQTPTLFVFLHFWASLKHFDALFFILVCLGCRISWRVISDDWAFYYSNWKIRNHHITFNLAFIFWHCGPQVGFFSLKQNSSKYFDEKNKEYGGTASFLFSLGDPVEPAAVAAIRHPARQPGCLAVPALARSREERCTRWWWYFNSSVLDCFASISLFWYANHELNIFWYFICSPLILISISKKCIKTNLQSEAAKVFVKRSLCLVNNLVYCFFIVLRRCSEIKCQNAPSTSISRHARISRCYISRIFEFDYLFSKRNPLQPLELG